MDKTIIQYPSAVKDGLYSFRTSYQVHGLKCTCNEDNLCINPLITKKVKYAPFYTIGIEDIHSFISLLESDEDHRQFEKCSYKTMLSEGGTNWRFEHITNVIVKKESNYLLLTANVDDWRGKSDTDFTIKIPNLVIPQLINACEPLVYNLLLQELE